MKVLYLSEWYPHRYDAMSGLFVRKHAISCARQGVDVCVLYAYKAPDMDTDMDIQVENTGAVKEIFVYYRGNYITALRAGWKRVRQVWGMPEICQLNVITKNAILPLWLKITHSIPYVIVEHWTGYLHNNPQYLESGVFHKTMTRIAAKFASAVMPVSSELLTAMKQCGLNTKKWQVINNVVDDFFYNRTKSPLRSDTFNLLHISCFDEPHKNVCGILRAARRISGQRSGFRLTIVGVGPDYQQVKDYADELDFAPGTLKWTGELTPEQVAIEFDNADAFVLFSNYETAGVVLSEALATGTPIISTPVGIAPDCVDKTTGTLVPIGDENALADAIETMMDNISLYDEKAIRLRAEQYSMDKVGKQLREIYENSIMP